MTRMSSGAYLPPIAVKRLGRAENLWNTVNIRTRDNHSACACLEHKIGVHPPEDHCTFIGSAPRQLALQGMNSPGYLSRMHKWGFGPMETIQSEAFYRMIGRTGITYGDTFRMVKRVASNDAAAMMRCVAFPLSTFTAHEACLSVCQTFPNQGHTYPHPVPGHGIRIMLMLIPADEEHPASD